MIETAELNKMMEEMPILHPVVYKSGAFNLYLEKLNGMHIMHIKIKRFSHTVFKKILKILAKLKGAYGADLYAYGVDPATIKLMDRLGFVDTGLVIKTTIGEHGRIKRWHQS